MEAFDPCVAPTGHATQPDPGRPKTSGRNRPRCRIRLLPVNGLSILHASILAVLWWLLGVAWTASAATGTKAGAPVPRAAIFYVLNHGWHSGIVVPRAAIPPGAWPPGIVEHDFAGCAYLELGWGDRKFYPAKHPGVLLAVSAACVPGPSVLHIAGLNPPLASALHGSNLVTVPCTRAELGNLCRDLGQSFETDAHGRVTRMGPGLYGTRSGFYPARGRYWIGNTCNTWTAREMRAGGLAARTDVFESLTSGEVVGQARRLVRERERETIPDRR